MVHDDNTQSREDVYAALQRSGAIVIRAPRQWFSTGEYAWDTHLGDTQLVETLWREMALPPTDYINPQEWAAGIVHDPLFGADPDPHHVPRPPEMGADFVIEIDKYAALALHPDACQRPALAIPHPDRDDAMIIDGWKRIYRAYRLGLTAYPVYLVNREMERLLRIPVPPFAY